MNITKMQWMGISSSKYYGLTFLQIIHSQLSMKSQLHHSLPCLQTPDKLENMGHHCIGAKVSVNNSRVHPYFMVNLWLFRCSWRATTCSHSSVLVCSTLMRVCLDLTQNTRPWGIFNLIVIRSTYIWPWENGDSNNIITYCKTLASWPPLS